MSPLMLAIIGSLRPVAVVAPKITFVGSVLTPATVYFGSGTSDTTACDLPSGCHAGDACVVSAILGVGSNAMPTVPPGAVDVQTPTTFATGSICVYVAALTQAQVDAGSIDLTISHDAGGAGVSGSVMLDVYRGASTESLDSHGATATFTHVGDGQYVLVNSDATVTDNTMLQYSVLVAQSGGAISLGVPTGWTAGAVQNAAWSGFVSTAHRTRATAGNVPALDAGPLAINDGTPLTTSVMLALRRKHTGVVLTESLGALKVGVAFIGAITATNTDGATGDIVITHANFPTGISAGTLVDNGDGSWTLPITGTPTEAGAFSATFHATNGTQSASYAWSDTVAANPMTLTGTLPGATIGSDYHGELTLGGYYQTPVTIDASSGTIPSWMTVTVDGATINFDATAANVPSVAETDTFTARATDANSQTATSEQTVVVSAAAAGAPSVVQHSQAMYAGAGAYTFDSTLGWAAPTVGHTLLLVQNSTSPAAHTPSGWTLITQNAGSNRHINIYYRTATASDSSVSVDCGGHGNAALFELDGASAIDGTPTLQSLNATSATVACGTPTTDHELAIAVVGFSNSYTATAVAPADTVMMTDGSRYYYFGVGTLDTGTSRAAQSIGLNFDVSTSVVVQTAGFLLKRAA